MKNHYNKCNFCQNTLINNDNIYEYGNKYITMCFECRIYYLYILNN